MATKFESNPSGDALCLFTMTDLDGKEIRVVKDEGWPWLWFMTEDEDGSEVVIMRLNVQLAHGLAKSMLNWVSVADPIDYSVKGSSHGNKK